MRGTGYWGIRKLSEAGFTGFIGFTGLGSVGVWKFGSLEVVRSGIYGICGIFGMGELSEPGFL